MTKNKKNPLIAKWNDQYNMSNYAVEDCEYGLFTEDFLERAINSLIDDFSKKI